MNVRDWSGTETNKALHTVLALMGSISIAVIIVALFLAFTRHPVEKIKKVPAKVKETHRHLKRRWGWWNKDKGKEEDTAEIGRSFVDLERGMVGPVSQLDKGGGRKERKKLEWGWWGGRREMEKGKDGRTDSKTD